MEDPSAYWRLLHMKGGTGHIERVSQQLVFVRRVLRSVFVSMVS